jgi:PKD repeat protein
MKRALVLALAGLACGKTQAPVGDAAVERPATDADSGTTTVAPPLVMDFAIEGCPSFDAEAMTCTGPAPLTLRFVPLVTTTVSQYLWDFGDDSASFDQTPSHTYTLPKSYTVKLLVSGLDGMLVSKSHTDFVTVATNRLGEACDADAQCADKLTCLCPSTTPCDFGPPHGICTALCQSGTCGDGAVCAGLATGTTTNATRATWQASLCLRGCTDDSDCSAQLRCRLLPPGPGSITWVHGCFGDLPADVGGSCMDTKNVLRDDLCASGICTNLGAKGMCTMACSTQSCPSGADCGMLGDGRKLCLQTCTEGSTCSDDPLLDCTSPGAGDLGYRLANTVPVANHCAPKPCTSDAECAPSGHCDSPSSDGHCVARTD